MSNFITIHHAACNCEDRPCCGCDNGTSEVEAEELESDRQPRGWDAGEDDLADFGANEVMDYGDE